MARLRLNKTTKIILAISIVLLSTALGYLVWRVNQETQLSPYDSEASAGCPEGCFAPADESGGCAKSCDWKCTQGDPNCPREDWGKLVCIPCDVTEKETDFFTTHSACQVEADKKNALINMLGSDSCTKYPQNSKWGCKAVYKSQGAEKDGYVLTYAPCTTETKPPVVDCHEDLEPTTYSFNKANAGRSKIGPFPKDGKLVLYFKNLLGAGTYKPTITFKLVSTDTSRNDNQTYSYTPKADEDRTATDFTVKKGEYVLLTKSVDNRNQGDPECAPTTNNDKYESFGWIDPSSDGKCGSGLLGPPSSGSAREAYPKYSISTFRSNAVKQGYEKVTNGEQCWADWREWAGDYDFNDYFLMVSYAVEEPIPTPNLTINKSVVESCTDEDTSNPTAELAYTIAVTNTGGADGEFSKIEDILDSKVEDSFVEVSSITGGGTYADGKIVWDGNTTVKAGESISYTYTLVVDKDSFDTYSNTVTLTTGNETKTDKATITADCVITEEPEEPEVPTEGEIPQTGIFDSTAGRILAGVSLVVIGALVYISPNISLSTLNGHIKSRRVYIKERNISKLRKRFEKKVEKR